MLDFFTLGNSTQCDTPQCYFTSKYQEILDLSKAYINDNDTDMILNNIQKPKNVTWTAAHLKSIIPKYKTPIKEGIKNPYMGS